MASKMLVGELAYVCSAGCVALLAGEGGLGLREGGGDEAGEGEEKD